jgi:hypothetical protein
LPSVIVPPFNGHHAILLRSQQSGYASQGDL